MKRLVKTDTTMPFIPSPGEARLYITDELPAPEQCSTAFGFVFVTDRILLPCLHDRDWDLPGGMIEPGESPEEAAVREVWEETSARVKVVELIGIQEIENFGPKPANYRWPYPISTQVFFLCDLIDIRPFEENAESTSRQLFAPQAARLIPTMINHDLLYEEGLRRAQLRSQGSS